MTNTQCQSFDRAVSWLAEVTVEHLCSSRLTVKCSSPVLLPRPCHTQLWEPLRRQHKGSQTAENVKRLVVRLALCCCCFCFYCRGGIHDGLMNRGLVSDGLWSPRCSHHYRALLDIAHTLKNSEVSQASRRLSVFLSVLLSSLHVCARWLFVCVSARGCQERRGVLCSVTDTAF